MPRRVLRRLLPEQDVESGLPVRVVDVADGPGVDWTAAIISAGDATWGRPCRYNGAPSSKPGVFFLVLMEEIPQEAGPGDGRAGH